MDMKKLKAVVIVLAVFFILSFLISSIFTVFTGADSFGNVALIKLSGTIVTEGNSGFGETLASSSDIVKFIKEADEDPSIKAIVLEINSPGGSPVASKEIVDAVKRTNKTTYAFIREIGTSGAYWAASATDKIIAHDLSVTGSIGVFSSYLEFSGLLKKYNITYQRLVAGKYKDMGSPFKKLEKDEEDIIMEKLIKLHEYFINSVAENRNMDVEQVRELATGEFFLGSEALDNGLVDKLGDIEALKDIIKSDLDIAEVDFAVYSKPPSFFESLAGIFSENSFFIGKGIGSAITESDTKISITT